MSKTMTPELERMAEIVAAHFDRDYDGGDVYDQLMEEFPDEDNDEVAKAVAAARSMVMAMDLGDDTEKRAPKVRHAFLQAMGVEDPLAKLMRAAYDFKLGDWVSVEEDPYKGEVEITPIASLDLADLPIALHYLENKTAPSVASSAFSAWVKNTGASLDLSDPDALGLMNACLFSLISGRPTSYPEKKERK